MSIPQASQLRMAQQEAKRITRQKNHFLPEATKTIIINHDIQTALVSPEMMARELESEIDSLESKLYEIHNIKDYETTPVNNNYNVYKNINKNYTNNNGNNTNKYMKEYVEGVRKRIAGKNQKEKISMLNSIENDLRFQLADAKFNLAKLDFHLENIDFHLENKDYYEKNLENLLNLKINREENLINLIAKIINEKIRWEINREMLENSGIEQTKWSPSKLDYDTEQQMIDLVKSEIELVKSKLEHDFKVTKRYIHSLEKKNHNKLDINRPGVGASVAAEVVMAVPGATLAKAAAEGRLDEVLRQQLYERDMAEEEARLLAEQVAAAAAEAAADEQNFSQSPGTRAHGGRNRKISRKKKNKTSLLKRKYKKQTRKYRKTKKRKLYKQ